jgi:hypothetical protein
MGCRFCRTDFGCFDGSCWRKLRACISRCGSLGLGKKHSGAKGRLHPLFVVADDVVWLLLFLSIAPGLYGPFFFQLTMMFNL